jgi:hypothetical protein
VCFSIRANDHILIFACSERVEPYQRTDMYEHLRTPMKACEHLWRSANISEVLRRSSNDFEDIRRSMKPFDYTCGCIAFVTDIMDTFPGQVRHPRSPVKSCKVLRRTSRHLRTHFGAFPRSRTIPQYLGIVPFDCWTLLTVFRVLSLSENEVLSIWACGMSHPIYLCGICHKK